MTTIFATQSIAIVLGIASLVSSNTMAAPASATVQTQWKVCMAKPMITILRDASCNATMKEMGLTPGDVAKLEACSAMTRQQRSADSHCQQLIHDHPGALG